MEETWRPRGGAYNMTGTSRPQKQRAPRRSYDNPATTIRRVCAHGDCIEYAEIGKDLCGRHA